MASSAVTLPPDVGPEYEVYLNGVLAAKAPRWIGDYDEFDLSADAIKSLKPGRNVIAVHCHQTSGGQYIDVGIVDLVEQK